MVGKNGCEHGIDNETAEGEVHPFDHCVSGEDCDQRAHGCVTYVETCGCGATREANVNGTWEERGPWSDGAYDEDEEDPTDPRD